MSKIRDIIEDERTLPVPENAGGLDWSSTVQTVDFTAEIWKGYHIDTATVGAVEITLPLSPSTGDMVGLKDYSDNFGEVSATILRNGEKIEGSEEDLLLDLRGWSGLLVYTDAVRGWTVVYGTSYTAADNVLLNGAMQVWQEDTVFSGITTGDYTADQWSVNRGDATAGTVSATRIANFPTDTNWTDGVIPEYSMNIVTSSISGGTIGVQVYQYVENVKTLAGKSATLRFTIRNSGPSFDINPTIIQYFGAGGSAQNNIACNEGTQTIGSGANQIEVTFDLPTLSGVTLDTGYHLTVVPVRGALGHGDLTFSIGTVCLEEGLKKGVYRMRTYKEELSDCQRYFWSGTAAVSIDNAIRVANNIVFPVTMRTTPSITATPNSGSGVTFTALDGSSCYQSSINTVLTANCVVEADARI